MFCGRALNRPECYENVPAVLTTYILDLTKWCAQIESNVELRNSYGWQVMFVWFMYNGPARRKDFRNTEKLIRSRKGRSLLHCIMMSVVWKLNHLNLNYQKKFSLKVLMFAVHVRKWMRHQLSILNNVAM